MVYTVVMDIRKKKESVNYLIKELPDFNHIVSLYRQLHKVTPTIPQIRKIQALWNKIESDEPEITRKPLF